MGEIVNDINILIEVAADTIAHEYDYQEINEVTHSGDYGESINKLFYNLEVLTKSTHMLEDVFKALSGILAEKKEA